MGAFLSGGRCSPFRTVGLCLCLLIFAPATASAAVTQPAFGPKTPVATLTPGGSTLDLTNADFTGDGRQDVLVARGRWGSTADYPISILAGDGTGGFADRAPDLFGGPVPRQVWPRQALLADFNGDGRTDIFVGDSGLDQPPFPGSTNDLALSTPGGGYADASGNLPAGSAYFHSGATGDVDGDGDIDIFLADLGTPLRVLLNDGTGHFTTATGLLPASLPSDYTRSALVDVNGDGALDLVLLGSDFNNASSTILLNDGHGHFTQTPGALPAKPFGPNSIGIAIQVVNLNGDGHPDLMLGYTKGDPWYVGRWIQMAVNNGDGTFRDETAARLPQSDNNLDWPYEIVLGDLNSDGAVDFGIDVGSNFCCVGRRVVPPFYLNRGDGTFEALPASAFADAPYGQFRLIDVNGDGLLDVFGVWQQWPADAPEQYAVQLQLHPTPVTDGDGDGVPDERDRCPRVAGHGSNGCPGPTLRRAGPVRTRRAGRRGVRLDTGMRASCPPAGFACAGRARVVAPGRKQLGSAVVRVRSGATSRVAFRLSARGAARLRKARRLRVKITLAITGPDRIEVRRTRSASIRAPKR